MDELVQNGAVLFAGVVAGFVLARSEETDELSSSESSNQNIINKRKKERRRKLVGYNQLQDELSVSRPELFYDLVFDVQSPHTITRGWPVCWSPSLKKSYFNEGMKGVVVAIIGGFDKGKSFIFTRLVDADLPSGARVHTRGLSFKGIQHKQKSLVLIDSAGMNAPIKFGDEIDSVEQKEAEEHLVQDLIFEIADLFIYVVNEITWQEQVDLERFTQRLRGSDKTWKQLFVVHNFLNSVDDEELHYLWKENVLYHYATTEVEEQHYSVVAWDPLGETYQAKRVPFLAADSRNQRHFFLGNEATESASTTNPWNLQLLRDSLFLAVAENAEFNLLQRLLDASNKYLPRYLSPLNQQLDLYYDDHVQNGNSCLLMKPNCEEDLRPLVRRPLYLDYLYDSEDEEGSPQMNRAAVNNRTNDYESLASPKTPLSRGRRASLGLVTESVVYDVGRVVGGYVITIEAAGVKREDVSVRATIESNDLEIKFTIHEPPQQKIIDKIRSRRKFGEQRLKMSIPLEFDIGKRSRQVSVASGIIRVFLPQRFDG